MNYSLSRSVARAATRRELVKPPVAIDTTLFVDTSSQQPSNLAEPKSLRMFSSSHNNKFDGPANQLSAVSVDIHAAQTKLLKEANYLTKTLYRKCLKSIQSLARGNERDETDFSEREQSELDQLDELYSSSTAKDGTSNNTNNRVSLMAPPVNRQNELSSRANYYQAFTREHFDGHWNLLGKHGFHLGEEGNMRHGLGFAGGGQEGNRYEGGHHHLGGQMATQYSSHQVVARSSCVDSDGNNSKVIPQQQQQQYYMWREEQIEQFTYLITSGEEKRQWILNDYEFKDPCSKHWPEELRTRIRQFEESANALVKEMYRRRGWIHSSDHQQYARDASEDSDSDDDDF